MTSQVLANRSAIVTGAGAGIGQGVALRLAAAGARVLVAEFDPERAEETQAAIAAAGGQSEIFIVDVTEESQVQAMVAQCVARFGAVDILVNNAYSGYGMARIETMPALWFEHNFKINFWAARWSMLAAFPHMRAKSWGRIINMCSLNGVNAHMGSADYNSSKEALRAFTRTAAREWAGYGICANIICPAAESFAFKIFASIQPETAAATTAANPMRRMGDPQADIGGVVVFLASEDARYLTGNTLFVDGGSHINGAPWVPDLPA